MDERDDIARVERYGAGAGILAVVVLVAAIAFESLGPAPTDSAAKVASKFAADQAGVLAGSYLLIVAIGLYVIFLAALRSILRRAEGEPGTLSALTLVAGVGSFVTTAVYVAIYASLAHQVAAGAGADVVFALFRISNAIDAFGGLFIGLALIAASVVILQTSVFPRWVGWLGSGAGTLGALGTFALDDPTAILGLIGFLGLILSLVWTLVVSLLVLRRRPVIAEG